MSLEVISFITNYGYAAIFFLVFIQEMGIPNPVPNELVLVFTGYLTFKGILNLPLLILTAISADVSGTSILYTIFYFFGGYILKHKPKWWPLSEKVIDKYTKRLSEKGTWVLYVGRMTPVVRGYTSVITGFLQIKPKVFLPIALISAIVWASICVLTGRLLGPYWSVLENKFGSLKIIILVAVVIILLILAIKYFQKRRSE